MVEGKGRIGGVRTSAQGFLTRRQRLLRRAPGRLSRDRLPAARFEVEDDDLVPPRLQPATGAVQRLLRADVPKAAEVVAVHPHDALAPRAEVEERVADLPQLECAAVERRP